MNIFYRIADEQNDLFWWEGEDPELKEFVGHVENAPSEWAYPWRPFDTYKRTDLLVEYMTDAQDELIQAWTDERIYWDNE